METVTITRSEYEELIINQDMLSALREAGVDNWEGYNYAIDIYNSIEENM